MARVALQMDEGLAEPHNALAMCLVHARDRSGAEREFQRAIALNPNYAQAHQWYGYRVLRAMGRQNWVAEVKRAGELDPLSPVTLRSDTNTPGSSGTRRQRQMCRDQHWPSVRPHPIEDAGSHIDGRRSPLAHPGQSSRAVSGRRREHGGLTSVFPFCGIILRGRHSQETRLPHLKSLGPGVPWSWVVRADRAHTWSGPKLVTISTPEQHEV